MLPWTPQRYPSASPAMSLLRASYDQLAIVDYSGRSAGIFWMLAFRPLFASPTFRVLGLTGQHLGGFERGAPAGANGA